MQTERDRRTRVVMDGKPDPYAPDHAAQVQNGESRQRKRGQNRRWVSRPGRTPRWGQRLLRTPGEREFFAVMADQLGNACTGWTG